MLNQSMGVYCETLFDSVQEIDEINNTHSLTHTIVQDFWYW